MPSPIPKRSDQRARTNSRQPQKARAGAKVSSPAPDPSWTLRAREFYLALRKSGQSAFYEASDWALARVAADLLTMFESAPRAAYIEQFLKIATMLMAGEADRRRMYLELRRDMDDGAEARPSASSEMRAALSVVPAADATG